MRKLGPVCDEVRSSEVSTRSDQGRWNGRGHLGLGPDLHGLRPLRLPHIQLCKEEDHDRMKIHSIRFAQTCTEQAARTNSATPRLHPSSNQSIWRPCRPKLVQMGLGCLGLQSCTPRNLTGYMTHENHKSPQPQASRCPFAAQTASLQATACAACGGSVEVAICCGGLSSMQIDQISSMGFTTLKDSATTPSETSVQECRICSGCRRQIDAAHALAIGLQCDTTQMPKFPQQRHPRHRVA